MSFEDNINRMVEFEAEQERARRAGLVAEVDARVAGMLERAAKILHAAPGFAHGNPAMDLLRQGEWHGEILTIAQMLQREEHVIRGPRDRGKP
jgi:hypothetical protein